MTGPVPEGWRRRACRRNDPGLVNSHAQPPQGPDELVRGLRAPEAIAASQRLWREDPEAQRRARVRRRVAVVTVALPTLATALRRAGPGWRTLPRAPLGYAGAVTKGPVLIVDDDPNLREVVRVALELQQFAVVEAADGLAGVKAFEQHRPVAVVLDLMMPELDGFEVCRRIRAASRVPIVFLSSRDDELDRVLGLELGGDDYVTKPFSPRELVARVKAVLRRASPAPEAATPVTREARLSRGPLTLDFEAWRAFWRDAEVTLTVMEFQLLATLLRAPTRAFTRDELIERAYEGVVVSDRTVDSHIRRVRQKFAAVGGAVVETVHGVGYRLGLP